MCHAPIGYCHFPCEQACRSSPTQPLMLPLEWLGVDSRSEEEKAARPEDCADRDPLCADWAKRGECDKNKKVRLRSVAVPTGLRAE